MAKHLTQPLKQKIVEAIKGWQDPVNPEAKITWVIVETIAETITGEARTRQALNKQADIKKAYEDRNSGAASKQSEKDKQIERLRKDNERLQAENAFLLSRFLRWSYNARNATRVPVDIEDLERPLPNPERVKN